MIFKHYFMHACTQIRKKRTHPNYLLQQFLPSRPLSIYVRI